MGRSYVFLDVVKGPQVLPQSGRRRVALLVRDHFADYLGGNLQRTARGDHGLSQGVRTDIQPDGVSRHVAHALELLNQIDARDGVLRCAFHSPINLPVLNSTRTARSSNRATIE
jgi:hypothetical protein